MLNPLAWLDAAFCLEEFDSVIQDVPGTTSSSRQAHPQTRGREPGGQAPVNGCPADPNRGPLNGCKFGPVIFSIWLVKTRVTPKWNPE